MERPAARPPSGPSERARASEVLEAWSSHHKQLPRPSDRPRERGGLRIERGVLLSDSSSDMDSDGDLDEVTLGGGRSTMAHGYGGAVGAHARPVRALERDVTAPSYMASASTYHPTDRDPDALGGVADEAGLPAPLPDVIGSRPPTTTTAAAAAAADEAFGAWGSG